MHSKESFLRYIEQYYKDEKWDELLDEENVTDVFIIRGKYKTEYKHVQNFTINKEFPSEEDALKYINLIKSSPNCNKIDLDSIKISREKPWSWIEKSILKEMLRDIDNIQFPIFLP